MPRFWHDFIYPYFITHKKLFQMKNSNFLTTLGLLAISFSLSSCEAIGDIFKAGMGFGIFIVLAVIGIIVFIAMKAGKKS